MFGIGDGPAQIVPQSPHAPDILGRIFQLSDGLVAAHQVHHGLQGVDYPARAGHGPIDFVAYLGEGVGQLVRTAGQLVQLASVLFEQGGRFVELAAHFTSLKRDLGLLQSSPFGRVKPRTITMLGNSAISRDIISMSASAPGVRRSRGI